MSDVDDGVERLLLSALRRYELWKPLAEQIEAEDPDQPVDRDPALAYIVGQISALKQVKALLNRIAESTKEDQ